MIVCHCQCISDKDIEEAVEWIRAADPHAIITVRKIYRVLGKSANCGGCMSLFVDKMHQSAKFRIILNNPQQQQKEKSENERRQQSH